MKTRKVTRLPGSEGIWGAKCARDGRMFAFAFPEGYDGGNYDYKVLEPGGRPLRNYALPERIDYPNWSRDGRYVYAIAERSRRLVRLDLAHNLLETVAAIDTYRLDLAP
jgi:hypothetical protein